MIITSGLILPKELRISKDDLRDIIIEIFYHNKNVRLKGLDGDIIFLADGQGYEIVIEVEKQT